MHDDSFPPQVRALNPQRDLLAIADLIELCFAETLDQSGREYIRQLRQMAREAGSFWIGRSENHFYAPRDGFVWEEDGKVIGNLSIFPFRTAHGMEYLIANVAVHPDYRRRGIARTLTERAIAAIRDRGGRQAWLNVRAENYAAYSLYRGVQFRERYRRTHWQYLPPLSAPQGEPILRGSSSAPFLQIRRRMAADWETQRRWLIASYPEDYHWHLDFQTDWFAPGILAWLKNLLSNSGFQHFSITKHRQLIGVATFQSNPQQGKLLWMACDPQWEDEAFRAFLSHLDSFRVKEKISLDYPALRAVQPLQEFGFTPTQTLIWMNRPIAGHKPIALQNTLSRTH